MSSMSISKIHMHNSTRLSLNDRFTAISKEPNVKVVRRARSRSRSMTRPSPRNMPRTLPPAASVANRRLLNQLTRRDKIQAALKLKRRSMRPTGGVGGGIYKGRLRRGTVKAYRVAANGKPIKTNSLANDATMNADFIMNAQRGRPLRRGHIIAARLGYLRAGSRNSNRVFGYNALAGNMPRGRSRSRSRLGAAPVERRGRSRSRLGIGAVPDVRRGRSMTRGGRALSRGRSQSRARSQLRNNNGSVGPRGLPIRARLGVRPGAVATRNNRRRLGNVPRTRNASVASRGVAAGRIVKRRNSTVNRNPVRNNVQRGNGAGARNGRLQGRSRQNSVAPLRNRTRSQSRARKGTVGQQRQQRQPGGGQNRFVRRGRSQQRNGNANGGRQQQRRNNRSQSRGGRGGRGNQGRIQKQEVNKDALDKELDQYMATTKTENNIDYLLNN